MNKHIFILFFMIGSLLPLLLSAQPKTGKISFTAEASKKEVVAGGTIEVTYQLTGSTGGQLKVSSFGSFQQGAGTREKSGALFSGGNIQAYHNWVFSLTAPGPGDYTIPQATVLLNGVAYRSEPLTVKVIPAGKGNAGGSITGVPKGSDPNLFMTTAFNRTSVYVGQQVICTINVYSKLHIAGVDLVSMPKAGTALMKELERFDLPVAEEVVGGVNYLKQTIYAAAFFPEKAGKMSVPAVQANVAVESGNIFTPIRPVRLASEPVFIEVKPLPTPAPEGFTGVVGEYIVETKIDHDTATAGEAFICEISVHGNGNGRYFAPPKLSFPQGLEVFDPVVKEDESFENGRELVHRQVLEYAISAKRAGDYSCEPAIIWFDPDSSKYISYSPKLMLKVVQGDTSAADKINTPPERRISANEFWTSSKFLGFAGLGAALLLLLIYFIFIQKRETKTQTPNSRLDTLEQTTDHFKPAQVMSPVHEMPPTEAVHRPVIEKQVTRQMPGELQRLLYAGDAKAFYEALYNAVKSTFAKNMGQQSSTLSTAQITIWMAANGYDRMQIDELRSLLEICEQALYAGQQHTSEMGLLLEKAKLFLRP